AQFKRLFGKPPGPSNVKLNPALAKNPPLATHVDLFALDRTLPDGSNGAALYTFGKEQAQRLGGVGSMAFDHVVPFNDVGIEPDQVAGDGIYSGFVRLDLEQLEESEDAFLRRLIPGAASDVFLFSGHDMVGERRFVVPDAQAAALAAPIKLPSGITLSPVA